MKRCLDCGSKAARHPDPRSPPLETGDCLCDDCGYNAHIEVTRTAYEEFEIFMRTILDRLNR